MLIERLQYEAMHANLPQRWWEDDYRYRLKVEMMNLAVSLEGSLSQIYSNDVRWLNDVLTKRFQSSVFVEKEIIADKASYKDINKTSNVEFEDVNQRRNLVRIGTGVLTIAGYVLFAGLGPLAIMTSISVGTGSALISEKMFKGKIEQQKQAINDAIQTDVPHVINQAMIISEQRLKEAYTKVIAETQKQEDLWVQSQNDTIQKSEEQVTITNQNELNRIREPLQRIITRITNILEEKRDV
jgi:hypothetical protein